MLFYLRFVFICLWLLIAFGLGLVLSLVRWGNTSLNRFTAGLFAWPVLKLLGIRVEVEGLDRIEANQPCIYVANHQGALDIVTFGNIFPHRTVVIAKKEIAYIPILNIYFIAAGNILVDRQKRASAIASLGKAIHAIREKSCSVWIFPEGTRNRTQDIMLPLKKGAFYMAVESQVPLVPVVSAPIHSVLDRKKRRTGGTLKVRVLPPIQTQGLGSRDVDALSRTVHAMMVEAVRGLST